MKSPERTRWGVAGAAMGFLALSVVAGILTAAAVTPAVALTGTAADDTIGVFDGLPEYIKVEPLAQASTMYAMRAGKEVPIATFYSQNRVEVGWDDISQTIKDAAIATEDPRFYDHGGIDVTGTIRGALLTALHKDVQGGSSITQQYVKNILVQRCENQQVDVTATAAVQKKQLAAYQACYYDATQVDPVRKLKEMRYAIGLEKEYSKNQILQSYLNIALFGGRVYGVQSAAEYYFGVSAKTLNLQQAATLVAILNNPDNLRIDRPASTDNGAKNGYALTLNRRNYVIDRMLTNGKITKAQHDAAIATKIQPKITPVQSGCMTAQQYSAAFFCDYVQRIIQQDPIFGATSDARTLFLNRGGLKIYTTLNLDLQAVSQHALSSYIPPTSPNLDLGASNVSTEVGTGRVITMVQNRAYNNTANPTPGTTAVNYNTDYAYGGSEGFQTGSSYKAFDLLEWLKEGHSLNEVIDASHHTFPQTDFHESDPCNDIGGAPWNVANDEGAASRIDVLNATAQSVNSAFAMMATKLDLCGIKEGAQALGVHGADEQANPFMANPSSVIGTNYIAPLSMATAYAGIANHGVACSPVAIDKIVVSDGTLHAVPKSKCNTTNPIDPGVAAAAVYALQGVLRGGGTAASANPGDGIPIFGKTGTTDNSVENWLVTSTTKIAQATWVGNVEGGVALRSQVFQGVGGGPIVGGGDVKFSIVKPIDQALDAAYGGGAFPGVDPKYLRFAPAPRIQAPAAPAPGAGPGGGGAGGGGGPGGGGGGKGGGGGAKPPGGKG